VSAIRTPQQFALPQKQVLLYPMLWVDNFIRTKTRVTLANLLETLASLLVSLIIA